MPTNYQSSRERGAYVAERAAALAGVPLSTLHYWDRNNIVRPSVSRTKVKVWSYRDLLKLRLLSWLRNPKTLDDGTEVRGTAMRKIRRAIAELNSLGLDEFDAEGNYRVVVDRDGHPHLAVEGTIRDGMKAGQYEIEGMLDLLEPFTSGGAVGPDLRRPRSHLRILPGKLSGSPHIVDTRLETSAVAGLHARGFTLEQISHFYSFATKRALRRAIELEAQLPGNLSSAA